MGSKRRRYFSLPYKQVRQDGAGRRTKPRAGRSPRFERLEDRQMLTVSTTTPQSLTGPINGAEQSSLLAVGSTVFGTTFEGGGDNEGVVFSMNADGSNYQVLHTFTGSSTDGAYPMGNLTLVGSTLYGTTSGGGDSPNGYGGTVYSINTDGSDFQVLHSFYALDATFIDGDQPEAGLTASGTTLYGTTFSGGSFNGSVFAINTDGSNYRIIHTFPGSETDGYWPAARLVLDGSTLYGTTSVGGSGREGNIFSVNVNGSDYKQLYSFNFTDGGDDDPGIGLTLIGSKLYGVSTFSGNSENGAVFSINTDGTDFQTLHTFGTVAGDGNVPNVELTMVGSALYGSTQYGGSANDGTIFSINPDGTGYQVLYSFPAKNGQQTGGLPVSIPTRP